MTARVLVAYSAGSGFTSRQAGAVGSQIAEVSGLDVDVQPINYVASLEPYVAVFLGWSGHSRAGRRETLRFLSRNAALLPYRRIWVVHHQPGVPGPARGRGPVRLSRLLVRHGVTPSSYEPPVAVPAAQPAAPNPAAEGPVLVPAGPGALADHPT